ncbi:MAG: YihY family inner membrane protein [Phycisphaeraceae bacterium]
MKAWIKKLEHELRVTLTKPTAQLTRGQRSIHLSIDLARHARRLLSENSATTMAAALTYRTIFGLIPMLVMALIVFRAFGGFADSKEGLTELVYEYLNLEIDVAASVEKEPALNQDELKLDGDPSASETTDTPVARSWLGTQIDLVLGDEEAIAQAEALEQDRANAEMKRRIDDFVGGVAEGATSISIGSIGVVGMLLLIWASVGLIVTVEKTFNVIFRAPSGRPWHVRIPIYWAIITLGPVLIWGSFYISTQLVDAVQDIPVVGTVIGVVNHFTALLVTWLLFVLLFKLMPNAQVAIRPAMAGAMVSALAWELMKAALRWYVENAVLSQTQAQLYGSLALIPVLLFWVYLSWMVVLAGLQVTHILQTLPAHRRGKFESSRPVPVARDPWLVIPVMSAVAQAFDTGKTCGIDKIAEQVGAPVATVSKIIDELVGRGLLHRLPNDDGPSELTLALPPGRIRIADLIATSPEHADASNLPGHELLMQLMQAQDKALADVTLEQKRSD